MFSEAFGVDYYPEQWPEERWSEDARLMAEAGFNVVRLAEFAWSSMEPANAATTSLARPRHRDPGGARPAHRPRHPDGLPATLAHDQAPGDLPDAGERAARNLWQPP